VCQEACGLFAATLASAVANGSTPPETYEFAVRLARERGLSAAIRDTLAQAADRPPEDYSTQQGWVRIALQNAFYQLLHATSLEQGIRASVMAGGDTDTNAAIAGALLGAVHGREAIPAAWMRSVLSARPLRLAPTAHPRPVELWPVDALELAEALLLARAA
jgi:ADP-ribosylglycohydrolase